MFRKLGEASDGIVAVQLHDEVSEYDFKMFASQLEHAISVDGHARVLILMDYPQDFALKAASENLVFWIRHFKDIERLAIVGQKHWEKWIEVLEKPFISTDIRYFDKAELHKAWDWIRS